jgi:hypothetical protein
MARTHRGLWESDLEAALLRKGVGALEAGRHTCADCGRTPLVGERIFRFHRHGTVCELCRRLRPAEPDGVEVVQHSERGHTVRLVLRRAA